ncbi:hypothetical protein BGX33_001611 [Mortierella sp. NVP41]|nr:hypothetical protein BGX33_001611 [Mortierella sp. NVP41]
MDGTFVKKEPSDDKSAVFKRASSQTDAADRVKDKDRKGRDSPDVSGNELNDTAGETPTNDDGDGEDEDEDEDEEGVFEVEKVVGHRRELGVLKYRIKWKGYSDEDITSEPEDSVFCTDMVKEYWNQYQQMGGKRMDKEGSIYPKPTMSSLSLIGSGGGNRKSATTGSSSSSKSSTSSAKSSYSNRSSSTVNGGSKGGKGGSSGARSGRISPEPLLPDLSPLMAGSAAVAIKPTPSKRARTRSPDRQPSQAPQRNSTTTTNSTAKPIKVMKEAGKGSTAADSINNQNNKENVPRKLTAVGPVPTTEETWTPPGFWESWDEHVERVEAIETRGQDKHDRSNMWVHLRWKNGRLTLHPLKEIHTKAAQKLIGFYELHLQFQESD